MNRVGQALGQENAPQKKEEVKKQNKKCEGNTRE